MTARNDITGDAIASRKTNDAFRDGWERIFGKKEDTPQECVEEGPPANYPNVFEEDQEKEQK